MLVNILEHGAGAWQCGEIYVLVSRRGAAGERHYMYVPWDPGQSENSPLRAILFV